MSGNLLKGVSCFDVMNASSIAIKSVFAVLIFSKKNSRQDKGPCSLSFIYCRWYWKKRLIVFKDVEDGADTHNCFKNLQVSYITLLRLTNGWKITLNIVVIFDFEDKVWSLEWILWIFFFKFRLNDYFNKYNFKLRNGWN